MIKFIYLLAFLSLWAKADISSVDITPIAYMDKNPNIKILDQKKISFSEMGNVKFCELSDVAYYQKTETLFFVGDKGMLYSFHAKFNTKIDELRPLRAVRLKNKRLKKFKKWERDSEGLVLDGKGRLIVSFEGDPKVAWFHKNSAKFGSLIKKYRLPSALRGRKKYRGGNKSLEALTWHKKYGLLAAAEYPVRKMHRDMQTIYALSGKKWNFKAEPEKNSGVVAMEIMDDGNVLVMERSFSGLLAPFVVTLKKVFLNKKQKGLCKTKVLLKMNTHKGWSIDNFEGLSKVGKNRYVMVSDDNDNFFQRTLLVYFEVLN